MYIKSIFEGFDYGSSILQFDDMHVMFLEKNKSGNEFPLHDVDDLIWPISSLHHQTKTLECVIRVLLLVREGKSLIRN